MGGRVRARTARVGINGLGYVGLPLTLLFREERIRVTGCDITPVKVKRLDADGAYIRRGDRASRGGADADQAMAAERQPLGDGIWEIPLPTASAPAQLAMTLSARALSFTRQSVGSASGWAGDDPGVDGVCRSGR
jgi:hypothetical protein